MTGAPSEETLVHGMGTYYARRAREYERVYHKPERQADLRNLERWVSETFAGARGLELACGTGWWTPHAASRARDWLATDLNAETMAIARAKAAMPPCVRFAELDAYTMAGLEAVRGTAPFDAAFAGFWWSHVPLARLGGWLALLHRQLAAGARVVFVDNRYAHGSSTPISRRDAEGNTYQQRRLDDGSTHEVLKNFPSRAEALAQLGPAARAPQWIEHDYYWLLSYVLA